jgi:hypothetical protein
MIKLHESQNQKAQYIALSHSWGGHHPITTTQSTLQDHKKGIHFDSLPKTFQDAILITRRLGHRYIWIDSLCIIQDSKSDWEYEAARMADVYQNAWLTISATRSSSPSNGCYNSEETQTVQMKGVIRNSPFILYARQQMEHVPLSWGPDSRLDKKKRFSLPLLARGWAFQERLLSARVLHFGPQELFWECREMVTCECNGIQGFDKDANIVDYSGAPPKIAHNRFANSAASRDQLHARWRSMAEEYSLRKLTVGTDRLPAFEGVAKEMQGYLGTRYLAGLWEDSFVTDLCWITGTGRSVQKRVRKRGVSSWPGTPSWSWAVVNCEVHYVKDLTEPNPKKRRNEMISCCEVVEVQWSPGSLDAYVVLEAWVIPGRVCIRDNKGFAYKAAILLDNVIKSGVPPTTDPQPSTLVAIDDSPDKAAPFQSDFPLYDEGEWYIEEGEKVYCAKIAVYGKWDNSDPQWLVLKCVDKERDVYERIGLILGTVALWDCTEGKRRIKIV